MNIKEQIQQLQVQFFEAETEQEALHHLYRWRKDFDSQIEGYMNSLKVLGDTTYEDRKHFLMELIQNADDAQYDEQPEIFFEIYDDSLQISYNELGFRKEDVLAITDTGGSTKTASKLNANSFIGEKGIGFKSVFALAQYVEIHSRNWHFRLNRGEYIIPHLLLDAPYENGTKLKVVFSDQNSIKIIANTLKELLETNIESFIFLQQLRKFHFTDYRDGQETKSELEIVQTSNQHFELRSNVKPQPLTYLKYEEHMIFPGHLVGKRWERLGSEHDLKRTVQIVVQTNASLMNKRGRLYSFLPTEVYFDMPVFIQVDGHLTADRAKLHDPNLNEWNRHLLQNLPKILRNFILYLKEDDQMAQQLPYVVPTTILPNQLERVLKNLKQELFNINWIRTNAGWSSPRVVKRTELYILQTFQREPAFKKLCESFYVHFQMHDDWQIQGDWQKTWASYEIGLLRTLDLLRMFEEQKLPIFLLQDDQFLANFYMECKDITYNRNLTNYQRVQLFSNAKIYPFDNGQIESLKNPEHVLWMSGRTSRDFQGVKNNSFKFIDFEFTRSISSSDQVTTSAELKRQRNEAFKMILQFLNCQEMTDEKLISDFQIPYILSDEDVNNRYNMLHILFKQYVNKRTYADDYIQQLARLRFAKFKSIDGKLYTINELILPDVCHFEPEDDIYATVGLQQLYIDHQLFELKLDDEIQLKKLRQFLIYMGIAYKPQFLYPQKTYQSVSVLKQDNRALYNYFINVVNNDYTSGNRITFTYVVLDKATRLILMQGEVPTVIADSLYEAWKLQYEGRIRSFNVDNYRENPPPGSVLASYLRRQQLKKIIPVNEWAGIPKSIVPLRTIIGNVAKSTEVRCIKSKKHFQKMKQFVPLVYAENYHEHFLQSLNVKELSVQDVNERWQQVGTSISKNELVELLIELHKNGLSIIDALLFDEQTNSLRPITDFRLGDSINEDIPYITAQYGDLGMELGKAVNLIEDSAMQPLIDKIEQAYYEMVDNGIFYELFKAFNHLNDKNQNYIRSELYIINNRAIRKPIVILSNEALYNELKLHEKFVVHIPSKQVEMKYYTQLASSFNFIIASTLGETKIVGKESYPNELANVVVSIFEQLQIELEEDETYNLQQKLQRFGGLNNIRNKIFTVKGVEKHIYGYREKVQVPYFDETTYNLYVQQATPVQCAIEINRAIQFMPQKFAVREFNSIFKALEAEKKKVQVAVATKKVESTGTGQVPNEVFGKNEITESHILEQQIGIEECHPDDKGLVTEPIEKASFKEQWSDMLFVGQQQQEVAATLWEEEYVNENAQGEVAALNEAIPQVSTLKVVEKVQKVKKQEALQETAEVRAFLKQQYDGHCQICLTKLRIKSKEAYFETYRIVESSKSGVYQNENYNVLCLCPNCHALAKHGGVLNIQGILEQAELYLTGNAWSYEVVELFKEMYKATVIHNDDPKTLYLTGQHLKFFAQLVE
ncbi:hypothetical protein [Psychrobacillus sp. BL-248-WT-3]|uniref:sacsin N-terminal ATP-binding-like domain-containing protein n=1 Tax=Psychrobacillus sp. BL-248-WT-3 TaxID=2725306 RepID=UPI00146F8B18|nr:hypothetical protein [Psychrobacillus sp. BL-248-WT-3]NME06226.1 hypothetical protein [Psychrobacillus sp. BL-248-WT-3]